MTSRNFKTGPVSALVALVLLFVSVSPAMGQDSMRGYKDEGAAIQGQIQETPTTEPGTPTTGKGDSGSLPFTGFETSIVLAMGLALAGMGLGLRRFARPPA